jgi:hypothetical protein
MPARRPGGKAASRKARQRNVPRTPRPTPAAPAPASADSDATVDAVERVEPIDATPAAAPPASRRPEPILSTSTGSGLSARERADYHYVERDLRNIGVLTLVMAAMLLGAWLLFNALGLVG